MLKKCKKNKAKIEKLEIDLFGLPQKDIDQNKKLAESNKRMKKDGLWKLIGMGKVVDYYRSHNTGFIKFEVLID